MSERSARQRVEPHFGTADAAPELAAPRPEARLPGPEGRKTQPALREAPPARPARSKKRARPEADRSGATAKTAEPAAEPRAPSAEAVRRLRRRRRLTPLTRRILVLNIMALVIPVVGLLYLSEYRDNLIEAELEALTTEAELFAGAVGASGVVVGPLGDERLVADTTRQTVRRLVEASQRRARLFAPDGTLLADSNRLMGPGGQVEIESLPSMRPQSPWEALVAGIYDWVVEYVPSSRSWPRYREQATQLAAHYPEAARALTGEIGTAVREDGEGGLILSVAVPVQRYRQVLGSLLLTTGSEEIDAAVRNVRLDILKVFGVALAITILLSLYLARTIARPIHRLAEAAERVRHGHGRQTVIPDFPRRKDEIGDLSGALKDMTEALWRRMDAIERFAADVAHEIKNPLTSLRSAVETAARIEDPVQQKKLMAIILDDVQRLDRLISDISDASRLDAELSRAETEPVDVGRLLETLARIHEATAKDGSPRFAIDVARHQNLTVDGIDSRLGQVFRNLITNAVSFSPAGGMIWLSAARDRDWVRVSVSDQGPGIPDGKLQAIFDRFYSERPAGEKFGTHSGLGLSISKQIVEAHGGTIAAANRRDERGRVCGARFDVSLPAAGA
ncbi:MAG: histidine kinase [Alphaproteobacteria bacterium]|nr:MAG: histidine kinase [Alphaproteobacteria bacterium]